MADEKERQRPWRPRISKPKSRTGCISCKKRKVKCDEGKPSCHKCLKFGIRCDGYSDTIIYSRTGAPYPTRDSPNFLAPIILLNPITNRFTDELEHRYFHSFWKEVAPRFKGAFTVSSVWTSIVLQASFYNSSIRHVIAATGALVRKLDVVEHVQTSSCDPDGDYSKALQYYQQALKGMKTINDARTALVACLLVSSFETHTGRIDLAIRTAQTGFKLLNDLLEKAQPSRELAELHPIPEVDKDLVSVFASLDVMLMPLTGGIRLNRRLLQDEPFGAHKDPGIDTVIPQEFSTISEARMCLESLIYWHEREFARRPTWGVLVPKLRLSRSLVSVDMRYRRWSPGTEDYETLRAVIRKQVHDNQSWHQAFDRLLDKIRKSSVEDLSRAMVLQLHSKTICLLLIGLSGMTECAFDQYSDEFEGFVSLCEIYLALPGSTKPAASLSCGLLFPLFISATRCRDWVIRRKAIELLKFDQVEIWNAKLLREVALWMMEIEENGLEFGEHVPEESRLRCGKLTVDYEEKRAWYSAYRYNVELEDEANHMVIDLVW